MMYTIPRDDFMIPTAEVPVTNFHRNEILKEEQLPIMLFVILLVGEEKLVPTEKMFVDLIDFTNLIKLRL